MSNDYEKNNIVFVIFNSTQVEECSFQVNVNFLWQTVYFYESEIQICFSVAKKGTYNLNLVCYSGPEFINIL